MSVSGRISLDVLFHDTDGTAALRVVSFEASKEYTSGKVASLTGTVGTAAVTVAVSPVAYKNAAGNAVSFSTIDRIAFSSSQHCICSDGAGAAIASADNELSITSSAIASSTATITITPQYQSGSCGYTLILYGT